MRTALALLTLLFSLLLNPCHAQPDEDRSWLVGRWEQVFDSETGAKGERDSIEFGETDEVASIHPSGARLQGRYRLEGRQLVLTFKLPDDRVVKTEMYVNDRKQLVYRSRAGATMIYERMKR